MPPKKPVATSASTTTGYRYFTPLLTRVFFGATHLPQLTKLAKLWMQRAPVLNQELLLSFEKILSDGQEELKNLNTLPLSENQIQFALVVQHFFRSLDSLTKTFKKLTISDFWSLKPEEEAPNLDIEGAPLPPSKGLFFGLPIDLTDAQEATLNGIFYKNGVMEEQVKLKDLFKKWLSGSLMLTPLSGSEMASIASHWTLTLAEEGAIIQHFSDTKFLTPNDRTNAIKKAQKEKLMEKVLGIARYYQISVETLNLPVSEERDQLILSSVKNHFVEKALSDKKDKIIETIFMGDQYWFVKFSAWMMGSSERSGYWDALKPMLIKLLSEDNGPTVLNVLMKTFAKIMERLHEHLDDRTMRAPKTWGEEFRNLLPKFMGGEEPSQAKVSFNFSCKLFSKDVAWLIKAFLDDDTIDSKEVKIASDIARNGVQTLKIWTGFFQEASKILLPDSTSGVVSSFDDRLKCLTEDYKRMAPALLDVVEETTVPLASVTVNEDIIASSEEEFSDALDINIDQETLSAIQSSVMTLHALSISWKMNEDSSKKDCVQNHLLKFFSSKQSENLKSVFLDRHNPAYVSIGDWPSDSCIVFSKKFFSPWLGLLNDFLKKYNDIKKETENAERVEMEAKIKKQILFVSNMITKLSKSTPLIYGLSENAKVKVLLVLQEKWKSVIGALADDTNYMGVSEALFKDLEGVMGDDNGLPPALPAPPQETFSNNAITWANPLIKLNKYLYTRAAESRYWHFFAFKWRNRLDKTIEIYDGLIKLTDPSNRHERESFDDAKKEIFEDLGWMILHHGGARIDWTFFSEKRPKDSWDRGLSLLKFFVTAIWSLINLLLFFPLWRRNNFSSSLKSVQDSVDRLSYDENQNDALNGQLQIVRGGLSALRQDFVPREKDNLHHYVRADDCVSADGRRNETNRKELAKKREDILEKYNILLKPEVSGSVPAVESQPVMVDKTLRWSHFLKAKGTRPSLKENERLYDIKKALGLRRII